MILEWVDKKDGDYIDPNDINKVAKGVQSLEKLIDDTKSSSVQKTKNGSSIYATNEKGEAITVRYAPNAEAYTVAYRDENGNIGVGSPVQEQDATNKQYVDSVRIGLEKSVANALKGNASGEAVRVDDVSPLARDMAVKVSGADDVGAVKVQKFGKNILPFNYYRNMNIVLNGVTFTANSDGGIRVQGTATSSTASPNLVDASFGAKLRDGVSYANTQNSGGTLYMIFCYKDETGTTKYSMPKKWSKDYTFVSCYLQIYKGSTVDTVFYPMIEVGDTATDYEKYIEPTEYAVNEDGTVDGVTPLYPTTTLMTDTAGVIIECEYNRDINKAFAELQQAIISMGGNV